VVRKLRPDAEQPGEIVHLDGRVLGLHRGVAHFTVGQRHGLGIGGGAPLYVLRLEPETGRVVVGPRTALAVAQFRVREFNWLVPRPERAVRATVKVRSTRPPGEALLTQQPDGSVCVELDVAEHGVAPGQACVAFGGSRVLGGGWIERPATATLPQVAVAASA
jgi:tRNA-specific 2-thiouridylase